MDNWVVSFYHSTLNLHHRPINDKTASFFDTWPLMTSSCFPVQSHLPLLPNFAKHSSHLELLFDPLSPSTPSVRTTCFYQCHLLYLDTFQQASLLFHLSKVNEILQYSAWVSSIPSHLGMNEAAPSLSSHSICS